jgi:hypothetical protein
MLLLSRFGCGRVGCLFRGGLFGGAHWLFAKEEDW